jgi:hypothetical protein
MIHGVLGPVVWVIEAAIIVGLFVLRRARRLGEEPAPRLEGKSCLNDPQPPDRSSQMEQGQSPRS